MRKKPKKKIVVTLQPRREYTWALDLGEHMGWATRGFSGIAEVKKPEELWRWLDDNILYNTVRLQRAVVYENAAYIQVSESAKEAFYTRKTVVELWCKLNGVPCESVVVATWQAWAKKQIHNFPPLPKKCAELRALEKLYPEKKRTEGRKAVPLFDHLYLEHQRALKKRKDECKQAYLDKARELWPIEIPDHNAGDARWVLGYYDEFVGVL